MKSISCAGSIALDTTRTPFKTVENVIGGAASYFSFSASFFAPVYVSGVVGRDFPKSYLDLFIKKGINISDVKVENGKTFHYDCSYSYDFYHRETNKTELNVLAGFEPSFSGSAGESEVVYLATMPPEKQLKALRKLKKRKLSFMDTIEFYIKNSPEEVKSVMENVNGVVLNDAEARMFTKENNLIKAGKKIQSVGPDIVVIKKGEHGSILFYNEKREHIIEHVIPFPAFPLEDIIDPNGAGDAFAGGFLGSLAERWNLQFSASSFKSKNPQSKTHNQKPTTHEPECTEQNPQLTTQDLKIAMAYANIMGAIAVRDFSINSISRYTRKEIEKDFQHYCGILRL